MKKNTTNNANQDAVSSWEDEGGAPEKDRRDKRADDALPRRPNDEVPANRREDPRNEGRDQDLERKDRRSSS